MRLYIPGFWMPHFLHLMCLSNYNVSFCCKLVSLYVYFDFISLGFWHKDILLALGMRLYIPGFWMPHFLHLMCLSNYNVSFCCKLESLYVYFDFISLGFWHKDILLALGMRLYIPGFWMPHFLHLMCLSNYNVSFCCKLESLYVYFDFISLGFWHKDILLALGMRLYIPGFWMPHFLHLMCLSNYNVSFCCKLVSLYVYFDFISLGFWHKDILLALGMRLYRLLDATFSTLDVPHLCHCAVLCTQCVQWSTTKCHLHLNIFISNVNPVGR